MFGIVLMVDVLLRLLAFRVAREPGNLLDDRLARL
jgi:hypothetical protein